MWSRRFSGGLFLPFRRALNTNLIFQVLWLYSSPWWIEFQSFHTHTLTIELCKNTEALPTCRRFRMTRYQQLAVTNWRVLHWKSQGSGKHFPLSLYTVSLSRIKENAFKSFLLIHFCNAIRFERQNTSFVNIHLPTFSFTVSRFLKSYCTYKTATIKFQQKQLHVPQKERERETCSINDMPSFSFMSYFID